MMAWRLLLGMLGGLLTMAAQAAVKVDSVRMHRAPDHTRVVFDLPDPVEHKVDVLANPDRVVVDLMDTDFNFDVKTLDAGNGPVADIRVGQHADKTRIVFDLKAAVRPRTNLLKPVAPHGWRLVVDLFDKDPPPAKTIPKPKASAEKPREMIVAVDAGHGGEDPGARGPRGTKEKVVVLQIAKKIYNMINNEPGMRAVLVRDGDYYVPLAERRRIAREDNHADVFISIHADAFTDARARGASVFALSNSGATSARARYLAKIANESDRVAGVYEEEKDDSNLLSVLADMRMSGSMAHSLYLGRQILQEFNGVTKLHGDRTTVEQAGFAVLKEPEMVSVLVETGFISNREEEGLLRSSTHQARIARAVTNGVKRYFQTHPAPNSYFAAQRRQQGDQYRIQPGDTLSAIARAHQVSEDALRAANNLNGDRIVVGQLLTIPGS
ncbi:N-acetylmuramoyl-L-alanine amidase [Alloalcanivorax xenomutans]|jgi:N-acetylmuramoyl-L-alanine amidase|nr:N-acetylmuramoyl-L-alanine amidase [Alloalcanivorax xenomutans]WOA32218.1 N-acetylmuramoyl-L-alanine amidase [Alloalcanivorax xenomutans]WOD29182.1 N-acetylmuramoyl-L-alanine amidase [Alloalcanivorax xenomutans]SOB90405.1 N-acetylmuramoyl-L-alanine amidase [Alloalcanivorax xenomutans]|tara:strand:+ start:1844 stop:3163 length:1320 start_codon:yes stop_codon:yes gene_type:complete